MYDGVLFYYSGNPYYPQTVQTAYLGGATFSFFVLFSISFTVIQFLYRYGLVVRTQPYSKSLLVGIALFVLIYIIGHHALFWYTFKAPNAEYDEILRSHGENLTAYIVADLRSINSVWVHFSHFQMIVFVTYAFNIWLGYSVWKYLKTQASKMSIRTMKAQKQITKVLVIQVSIIRMISYKVEFTYNEHKFWLQQFVITGYDCRLDKI